VNRKIFVILLFIISIISFVSCSDSPSSIGADLLTGDEIEIKNLDSYSDTLNQSSSYYTQKMAAGNASRIFLGKKGNVEASSLLKFYYFFPDSLKQSIINDSITVQSAKIYLTKSYVNGKNDESLPLDYTIHKINSSWTSNSFNEDSLNLLVYDGQDVGSVKTFSDTLYTATIDNNLISQWLEQSADTSLLQNNYGIYLKPSQSSEKIVGFDAITSSSVTHAKLETVIRKTGGEDDTIYAFLLTDVSVIKGTTPAFNPEYIFIQAGLASFGKLAFDLTKIPKNAVINNAELILTKDTLQSITGNSFRNNLLAFFMKDSSTNELDSTVSVTISSTDTTFRGVITSYVQRWQNGELNQGILLIPGGLLEGAELFAIRGSNATDYSKRPRLKITYTTIKQ
jgi:hypothetical protein